MVPSRFTLGVVFVLTLAMVVQAAFASPSLQLRIIFMCESMQIHGQSVVNVFANPVFVDNSTVRYDGFTTFIQGENTYTYVLADGIGYVVHSIGYDTTSIDTQTVHCLSSAEPFSSIVSALNNAISSSTTDTINNILDCTDGNLLGTSFGGVNFTICASSNSGDSGFSVLGGAMYMTVEYVDPVKKISAPTLTDLTERCEVISFPTSITPSTLNLLTGKPFTASRKLNVTHT